MGNFTYFLINYHYFTFFYVHFSITVVKYFSKLGVMSDNR